MDILLTLAIMAALIWFWVDSMRAHEVALKRCTSMCSEMDVQLLDQTVRLVRLRLGQDGGGRIQLRRFYVYDFSTDGQDRWFGVAILLGQNIEYIHMEHPQGPIIQNTKL